jgi:hypothetical protein
VTAATESAPASIAASTSPIFTALQTQTYMPEDQGTILNTVFNRKTTDAMTVPPAGIEKGGPGPQIPRDKGGPRRLTAREETSRNYSRIFCDR